MKRGWIVFWTVIGLLAGLLAGVLPALRQIRQKEAERVYLAELRGQMQHMDTQARDRQLSVAKWYNWNLKADTPDAGFEQAYGQILSFQDGAMALLVLPGGEIPVYHQGTSGAVPGAEHRADSALPIGGRGNRCVLYLPEEADASTLREGSAAAVYCLGRTLFYQAADGEAQADEDRDLLVLVPADGSKEILLRRCDAISITEKKQAVPSGLIYSALTAAILLTMLPVLTGICCKGVGKICRWNRNYRKIQGKGDVSREIPEKRWL